MKLTPYQKWHAAKRKNRRIVLYANALSITYAEAKGILVSKGVVS